MQRAFFLTTLYLALIFTMLPQPAHMPQSTSSEANCRLYIRRALRKTSSISISCNAHIHRPKLVSTFKLYLYIVHRWMNWLHNGWMDSWIQGWKHGWMSRWMAWWLLGGTHGLTDGWIEWRLDGCMDGMMDDGLDVWWNDESMNGWAR